MRYAYVYIYIDDSESHIFSFSFFLCKRIDIFGLLLLLQAIRPVTRIDIFWSLFRLLQQTTTSGIDSTNNQPGNAIDGGLNPIDSYQKPALPPPISLSETLR